MNLNVILCRTLALVIIIVSLNSCGGITAEEQAELDAEDLFVSGMQWFEKKQYTNARADFESALKLNPSHKKAANALDWTRQAMGDVEHLAMNDDKVAEPSDGDSAAADEDLPVPASMITEDEPVEFWEAYMDAMASYQQGDYEAMMAFADEAMAWLGSDSHLYHEISKGYIQALIVNDYYEEGAEWSLALLEESPDDLSLLHMGVVTTQRSGDVGQAVYLAEQAYGLSPGSPDSQNNLAYCYSLTGEDLELAYELSAQSLEARPNSPAYLDTMGWVLYQMGDSEAALEYITQAMDLMPPGRADEEIREHYNTLVNAIN